MSFFSIEEEEDDEDDEDEEEYEAGSLCHYCAFCKVTKEKPSPAYLLSSPGWDLTAQTICSRALRVSSCMPHIFAPSYFSSVAY